jgi:putative hydrolase of the HAD superfamily
MTESIRLYTDADNTLWDTNAVYANAQLALLREVEKACGLTAPADEDLGLGFLRAVDQRIAQLHADGLRYPPQLLARALAASLQGKPAEIAAKAAVEGAEYSSTLDSLADTFLVHLKAIPQLRPGVAEGIKVIADSGIPITVVTEERFERCQHLLEHHGIARAISRTVAERKTPSLYLGFKELDPSSTFFMVGDQWDRDIEPALAAGFRAFYFPGGFKPFWNSLGKQAVAHEIRDYREVAEVIAFGLSEQSRHTQVAASRR